MVGPTLKDKLNSLSDELSIELVDILNGSLLVSRWEMVIIDLQKKLSIPELSQKSLDHIEASEPERQSVELLKILIRIPAITPQIFLQSLADIGCGRLAKELSLAMNLPKPNKVMYCIIATNEARALGTGQLNESLTTFLSSRLYLNIAIYECLAGPCFGSENWELVANKLKEISRFRTQFNQAEIKKINEKTCSPFSATKCFLSYVKDKGVTVKEFVNALAQIGHFQNLCQQILNETQTPDYFRKHFKAGLTPPNFNDLKLDQQFADFLHLNLKIIDNLSAQVDEQSWAKIISHFTNHTYFRNEFKPNPIAWCQNVTKQFSSKYSSQDSLFKRISSHAGVSVGNFVTALHATGKFNKLCDEICKAAKIPEFMLVLDSKTKSTQVAFRR